MAITDPVGIKFANERIRPAADIGARGYSLAGGILGIWQAQDMASRVPNDPLNIVQDGSPDDGRTPISGEDVHAIIEFLTAYKALLETNASNGKRHIDNILKVSVNPTPQMPIGV